MNASSGWNPKVRLKVGLACSFSEWDTTIVASMSMIIGVPVVAPYVGAAVPARSQSVRRAARRAAATAARTRPVSRASTPIVREIVASEATGPYTPCSARNTAASARQSPASAVAIARSSSTLAGSCRAVVFRHGCSAALNAAVRPVISDVRVSRIPPAWPTAPTGAASRRTRGYKRVGCLT